MTEKELSIALVAQLDLALTNIGLTGVDIVASYQPTTQGEESDDAIYFFKVSDVKEGWQTRSIGSPLTPKYEEVQNIATTYQFMARARQIPKDSPQYLTRRTASDLLNYASMALQSIATVRALNNLGIGVRRVGEIRNPYFKNHSEQFEASPSFDFTVSHKTSIIYTTAVIENIDGTTVLVGDRNVD